MVLFPGTSLLIPIIISLINSFRVTDDEEVGKEFSHLNVGYGRGNRLAKVFFPFGFYVSDLYFHNPNIYQSL